MDVVEWEMEITLRTRESVKRNVKRFVVVLKYYRQYVERMVRNMAMLALLNVI